MKLFQFCWIFSGDRDHKPKAPRAARVYNLARTMTSNDHHDDDDDDDAGGVGEFFFDSRRPWRGSLTFGT